MDEVREEATGETVDKEMETVVEERIEEVTDEKTEEKAEGIEEEDDVVEEAEEMDVEVRGEKRSTSAEESGWVQIPPNKRKSGGSSGAGGAARVLDLTQKLEAVLAEDPLTPGGGSGSAAEDSVLEGLLASRVTGFHYHFGFLPNDLYLVFTAIERNPIMDNDFRLIPKYISLFGWLTLFVAAPYYIIV